ncbi:hypothetical protein PAXRUDRAFT_17159 [Paxillus rubicundulus Ve08.2h10]|uniref:Uncharacterized protein n=1 Tax=Paxillus rubicundulus Ve08.2h10 TaxID=930991 RepID=A0A0D0DBH3_9AGAM|nr:hypothetical protein PAXRUDRAFT_17159 [Paxillus rubicundulus Ve08.2h10]
MPKKSLDELKGRVNWLQHEMEEKMEKGLQLRKKTLEERLMDSHHIELDLSDLTHPSNINHIKRVSPELQHTTELLANWATDPKEVKQQFVNNPACPEFPDSEWNNIILGKPVNFDVVFSGMFTTQLDE